MDAKLQGDEHVHLKRGKLEDLGKIYPLKTDLGFGTETEDGQELAGVHCSPENEVAGDVGTWPAGASREREELHGRWAAAAPEWRARAPRASAAGPKQRRCGTVASAPATRRRAARMERRLPRADGAASPDGGADDSGPAGRIWAARARGGGGERRTRR